VLQITPNQYDGFANADVLKQRGRFAVWMRGEAPLVGYFHDDQLQRALDTSSGDAAQAGIDTEQRLFVHAAALLLMPEMNATQYLQTMDVIFGRGNADAKLRQLMALKTAGR
jgi:hypothetical protein